MACKAGAGTVRTVRKARKEYRAHRAHKEHMAHTLPLPLLLPPQAQAPQ